MADLDKRLIEWKAYSSPPLTPASELVFSISAFAAPVKCRFGSVTQWPSFLPFPMEFTPSEDRAVSVRQVIHREKAVSIREQKSGRGECVPSKTKWEYKKENPRTPVSTSF